MLARLIENRESRAIVRDPFWDQWAQGSDSKIGGNTTSGATVSETSALQLLTVYACVSFKSDAISVLPIDVFRDANGEKNEITAPSWINEPNPELAGPDLIGQLVASMETAGEAFVIPVRNSTGQTIQVWPLHPADVQVQRSAPRSPVTYSAFGQELPPNAIVHIKNFSLPGQLRGCSPIAYLRQTIGAGIAMEEYAGRWFGQGSTPSGVIETEQAAKDIDVGMLREQFEQFHRGVKKSHGVAVLAGGANYKPITIANKDAQFLESRNFTSASIANGIYRIYPDMVGATLPGGTSITYQNITDRWVELTRRAFMPLTTKLEWTFTFKLLARPHRAVFDLDRYTRADLTTLIPALVAAVQNDLMTNEEARDLLDKPPLPKSEQQPAVPVQPALTLAQAGT